MKPFYLEDLDGIPEDAVRLDVRTVEEYAGGPSRALSISLWTA
ncbi:MAG: hypothetical protein ACLR0U_22750 [Enterocloster clostridioformis]